LDWYLSVGKKGLILEEMDGYRIDGKLRGTGVLVVYLGGFGKALGSI